LRDVEPADREVFFELEHDDVRVWGTTA